MIEQHKCLGKIVMIIVMSYKDFTTKAYDKLVLRGALICRKILTIATLTTHLHASMLNDIKTGSAVDFVTKCCWNDLHFIWLNCLEYLNRRFKRINPNSFKKHLDKVHR